MPSQTNEPVIVDVWNINIDEIFRKIRMIVQKYPYVAMVSILKRCCTQPSNTTVVMAIVDNCYHFSKVILGF